jgi:diadenosine tetraphosphate (Ap4A) HIT family hydrolase
VLINVPGGAAGWTETTDRERLWHLTVLPATLGLGTLIVKPERHVTAVADLSSNEAAELGPLLQQASEVTGRLVGAEQVYNCLWSHAGGAPGHIHYVVQPVTQEQMSIYECRGPRLQMVMFDAAHRPDESEVAEAAERARRLFELECGGS